MASSSGSRSPSKGSDVVVPPDALFDQPERVELINKITDALNTLNDSTIRSFRTCYACLWLADMENLRVLANKAQNDPKDLFNLFYRVEDRDKIGQSC